MSGAILVTGATGTVGSAAVRELLDGGVRPRVASRDPERARSALPPGAEPVRFEFEDRGSVERALDGVDRMLLVTPPLDPREAEFGTGVIDVAKSAGVTHIVRLSAIGMERMPEAAHRRVELYLESSGIRWTHLRPNFFMQNLLGQLEGMRSTGVLYHPGGDALTPFVDAQDVGAAAARVLMDGGHEGRAYTLTGPEALGMAEVAARFAKALGREIRYQPITDEQYGDALRGFGIGDYGVALMTGFHTAMRAGQLAQVIDDLPRVLRRPARALDQFIAETLTDGGA